MDQGSLGDAGSDLEGPIEVGTSSEALAAADTGAEELEVADPCAEELGAANPGRGSRLPLASCRERKEGSLKMGKSLGEAGGEEAEAQVPGSQAVFALVIPRCTSALIISRIWTQPW